MQAVQTRCKQDSSLRRTIQHHSTSAISESTLCLIQVSTSRSDTSNMQNPPLILTRVALHTRSLERSKSVQGISNTRVASVTRTTSCRRCHGRLLRVKVYTAASCECVDKFDLCFKVRITSTEFALNGAQTYQLTPLWLLQVAQYGG